MTAAPVPRLRQAYLFARRLGRATLVSYAQILFSGRPEAGLLFLTASFCADPLVGLSGLVAATSANLLALRVWHDRIRWELGLAGYNAVLLGLALGLWLPHNRLLFLFSVTGGTASALATEWLNRRFRRLSLPVLGLPFLALAWLVLAFVENRSWHQPPSMFDLPVHGFIAGIPKAFGSAFFSPTFLSGLLVLAGLLVTSRIAAAVAMAGAILASIVGLFRAPSVSLSLNLLILPVGLVFFLVPGRRMLLQVLLGLLLTLGLSVLLEPALDAISMPMLFLPLTVTLFAFLLAGKARGSGIALVPVWLLRSPEDNVRLYMNRKKPVLQLPFFGTWFVSQGIDGGETHKGSLAHAWDFMVRDERGRTFAAPGYRLADYRAFGLQVAAPAPGKVVAIENGVPDNPPGRLNREQNWGNYVIIEHSFFEYSILAHLQHGSVRVRTGERVSVGAVIGACGNSGYSGQPHLHYQLQNAGLPGSDALTADFHNYLVLTGAGVRFIRSGRPTQDQTIQPLLPQDNIRQLFLSGLAGERRFVVQRGAVTDSETWSFEGHGAEFTALSLGTKLLLREEREGLVVVWVHGNRATLLARTFEGLEFLPFFSRAGLEFASKGWSHSFGRREILSGRGDALVLESVTGNTKRRVWLVPRTGIVRIEVSGGHRDVIGELRE